MKYEHIYNTKPYKTIYIPDWPSASSWGLVHYHRYLMECQVGRTLEKWEHVHHIDGDTQNNDISNLQLLSDKDHVKIHDEQDKDLVGQLIRVFNCPICGVEFTRRKLPESKHAHFCSKDCRNIFNSLFNSGNISAELFENIENNYIGQFRLRDGVRYEIEDTDRIFHINREQNYCKDCGKKIKNTSTYCIEHHLKNKVHVKTVEDNFCEVCGKKISSDSVKCSDCNFETMKTNQSYIDGWAKTRRVERPTKEILLGEIEKYGFTELGKKYGVSDNAVRKWCKYYDIDPKKGKNSRKGLS